MLLISFCRKLLSALLAVMLDSLGTDSLLREENPDSQLDDLVAFLRGKPRAIVAAVDHIIRDLYERKIIG